MPPDSPPFGHFKPKGLGRLLLGLIALGFGRGKARPLFAKLWAASDSLPVVDFVRLGIKWRAHLADNYPDSKLLFSSIGYDRSIVKALMAETGSGVFADIGANTGYYSLQLAHSGASVLALEPHPASFQRLTFNIASNGLAGRVTALQIGAGKAGERDLVFDDLGGSSLVKPRELGGAKVKVQVAPLTAILAQHKIDRIDTLKIDIEGAEDEALIPFFEATDRALWPRCVALETGHSGRWQSDVVAWMTEAGYKPTPVGNANLILRLQP